MNGSKIFAGDTEDGSAESGASDGNFNNRTSVRIVQVFELQRLLYYQFIGACNSILKNWLVFLV